MDNPFTVTLDSIRVRTDEEDTAEVVFSINNPKKSLYLIPVSLNTKLYSEDDLLKKARHYFHSIMRAVADKTEDWRIPKSDDAETSDT